MTGVCLGGTVGLVMASIRGQSSSRSSVVQLSSVSFFESTGLGSTGRRFFSTDFFAGSCCWFSFGRCLLLEPCEGFSLCDVAGCFFLGGRERGAVVIFSLTGGEDGRKRTTFGFPEGFTLLQRHLCHFFFFTALTEALRQKQKKRKAKEVSFPKSRSRGWTPHHVRRRLQSAQKPGVGVVVAGWGMLNCDTTLSSGCQLWTEGCWQATSHVRICGEASTRQ